MLKDPRSEAVTALRTVHNANRSLAIFRRRVSATESEPTGLPYPACALSTRPLVLRHENPLLALHQEAFLASATRHELRANSLYRRNRAQPALLHHRVAGLLTAYAQPGEIERLPMVVRPGPVGSEQARGVHPAIVAFAEGAAEEFFRIYNENPPQKSDSPTLDGSDGSLMLAFRRANFHRIYVARLSELACLIREGRSSALAEATLLRRYGPHDI